MSGHSHWATIRRKKGAADAKKGQVFSKIARQITLAARTGGGDPNSNLTLKYLMDKGREVSMPKDNIERAIKKGTGELDGGSYESAQYEAIGPGGIFILIDCLTDNRNRTAPEIKKILEMRNARLGSSAWAFEPKGMISVPASAVSEDKLTEMVIEAGGDDIQRVGETFQVITSPSDLDAVRKAIAAAGIQIENAELTQLPKNTTLVDAETGRKLMSLLGELEDHDDVQNVYTNMELPDELLKEAAEE